MVIPAGSFPSCQSSKAPAVVPKFLYSFSHLGSLSPNAISAAVPIDTASAPKAKAFATSAPFLIPPETINWTCRWRFCSCNASTDERIQARVGIPTCSIKISCVAAVPPCIPSITIASAPAFIANEVS